MKGGLDALLHEIDDFEKIALVSSGIATLLVWLALIFLGLAVVWRADSQTGDSSCGLDVETN